MKILKDKTIDESDLKKLIKSSSKPTIIALYKENSFGKFWLFQIMDQVGKKYKNKIVIHFFITESDYSVMIYFIKDGKLKEKILGSTSKKIFQAKLTTLFF